ncbi:MAG: hypothetical protein U0670_17665 [Anaerolineae bacterium]
MLDHNAVQLIDVKRPITFTIIDNQILLLQIDHLITKYGTTRTDLHGILIINDESKQIPLYFGSLFSDRMS